MIKKVFIGILVLLMSIQLLQYFFGIFADQNLHGVYQRYPLQKFNKHTWKTSEFQVSLTHHLENNFGFRPYFIQLNNQVYYSLFKQASNGGLLIGKKDYIYELNYISSYFGENYIGNERIDSSMLALNAVKQFLHEWNTKLVFVIAPNKANYYHEYIPDHYVLEKRTSNYDAFKTRMEAVDFPVMDVNSWFLDLKSASPYPLMTSTGTHWSLYGATVVADTLLRFMGAELNEPLNLFETTEIDYPCMPEGSDSDLEDLLNIFSALGKSDYAYPRDFKQLPNETGYEPNLIVIGDSFFWNLMQDFFVNSFDETQFWYYFSSIYPDYSEKDLKTDQLDVIERIINTDAVLVVSSTDNLDNLGFGFFDYVHSFLNMNREERFNSLIPRYVQSIKNNDDHVLLIQEKARQKDISVDSMMILDARWMANEILNRIDARPKNEN